MLQNLGDFIVLFSMWLSLKCFSWKKARAVLSRGFSLVLTSGQQHFPALAPRVSKRKASKRKAGAFEVP